MRHQYLMIDSRGNPVAHGTSDDGLEKSVWEIQVDSGDIKRVLSHEYVSLVSSSEKVPAMEGRIIRRDGNIISVESVRRLGEDVRRNLRMSYRTCKALSRRLSPGNGAASRPSPTRNWSARPCTSPTRNGRSACPRTALSWMRSSGR